MLNMFNSPRLKNKIGFEMNKKMNKKIYAPPYIWPILHVISATWTTGHLGHKFFAILICYFISLTGLVWGICFYL
jgi:hypothetical protein